jgi:hypothetical protein
MIDGKILSFCTGSASCKCPLCLASSKMMSKKGRKFQIKNPSNLGYGIATLHFLLRSFEFVLKIGFNQDFKRWQARGKKLKYGLL